MDFSNLKSVLVVLATSADNSAVNDTLKNSLLFQNLSKSVSNVTELNVDSLAKSVDNSEVYDAIVGIEQDFSTEQLEQIFKLLKPSAKFIVKKQQEHNKCKNLTFSIKVAGFIIQEDSDDVLMSTKPNYELGSSVKIDLTGEKKNSKKVWALDDDDVMDVDLINDEELLDDDDKAKPSAEELRVCATTKQRKACVNCSCGLKEELETEEIAKVRENSQNAKSSCGSCYLGDAFRCSSCPYKGLPAFKPGEKIVIDNTDDL